MYVNSAFKIDDETAWAFVEARGFGAVVAIDGGKPVAAHVPLMVTGTGTERKIEFHVARANPIHTVIATSPNVTVIVSGADAYVSPDWYVSTDQVPTWNYMAAHAWGTAAAMPPERAHAHVERMSLAFEARLAPKKPWSTSKMTEQRLAMMLRAIVPIEIAVAGLEASFKLSQNKTVADAHEVARMLAWRGSPSERLIADAMQERLEAQAASAKKEAT